MNSVSNLKVRQLLYESRHYSCLISWCKNPGISMLKNILVQAMSVKNARMKNTFVNYCKINNQHVNDVYAAQRYYVWFAVW